MFLGEYRAIYGFGVGLVPFYVGSVVLIVFVLFCKFSFSIFYYVFRSVCFGIMFLMLVSVVYESRYLDPHPFRSLSPGFYVPLHQ